VCSSDLSQSEHFQSTFFVTSRMGMPHYNDQGLTTLVAVVTHIVVVASFGSA
jgi:uncharacterized protein (DUF2164 family)